MQFQEIRYSNSHNILPSYPYPSSLNNQHSQLQNGTSPQFRKERINATNHIEMIPRQKDQLFNNHDYYNPNIANTPLAFNMNSPSKFKLKKGNKAGSMNNKSHSNCITNKIEDQFFSNQNNFNQRNTLQDFSKTTSTLLAHHLSGISNKSSQQRVDTSPDKATFTPSRFESSYLRQSPNGMKENTSIMKDNHSFGRDNDGSYSNLFNLKIDNQIFKDNDVFSKDTTIFRDNSYLLEQIKLQKQTIQNFQNQILKLNTQNRNLRNHQQASRKNNQSFDFKSIGGENRLSQKQFEWQQEQNSKLLLQIQKMQKQLKGKVQLNRFLEQKCNNYIALQKKAIQQLANIKEQMIKQSKKNEQCIDILNKEIDQLTYELNSYKAQELNYEGTLERLKEQGTRMNQIIQAQNRRLQEQYRSVEVDKSQINVLMMKLQTFQSKSQQSTQNCLELEKKMREQAQEWDKTRLNLDEKHIRLLQQKSKWMEREKIVSNQNSQLLSNLTFLKSQLHLQQADKRNIQNHFEQKINELNISHSKELQLLKNQIQSVILLKDNINQQLQQKQIYVQNLSINSKRKDQLYIKLTSKLQQKSNQLKLAYAGFEIKLKQQTQHFDKQIADKYNRINTLQSEVQIKQNQVISCKREQQKLSKDIDITSNQLSLARKQIQQLKQQLNKHLDYISSVQSEKYTIKHQLQISFIKNKEIQQKNSLLLRQCLSAKQQQQSLEKMLEDITNKNEIQKTNKGQHQHKYNELNTTYIQLSNRHRELLVKTAKMSQQLIKAESIHSQLEKCRDIIQQKEMIRQKQEQKFNAQLTAKQISIQSFQEKFKLKIEEINKYAIQIQNLKQANQQLLTKTKRLQQNLNNKQRQLQTVQKSSIKQEEYQSKLNELKRKHQDQLQSTISDHREQIDSLMAIIDGNDQLYKNQTNSINLKLKRAESQCKLLQQKLTVSQNLLAQNSLNIQQNLQQSIKQKNNSFSSQNIKINSSQSLVSPYKARSKDLQGSYREGDSMFADYIEVDKDGLIYMCNLLGINVQEGSILNHLIVGLQNYLNESDRSKPYSSYYQQILQLFDIEKGDNCQQLLLAEVNGFRDNLKFLIQKSKQEQYKNEKLITENLQLVKEKKIAQQENIKVIQQLEFHNSLANELNEIIMCQSMKLFNYKMQAKEAMLLAFDASVNQNYNAECQKGRKSQHFFTIKSFGKRLDQEEDFD